MSVIYQKLILNAIIQINFRYQSAQLHTSVSTSSDDLLSPSSSTPVVRNSLSNNELNISSKDGRSLDYYNFCAPTLPAHSNSQKKASLRNKLTLSGRQLLHSDDTLFDQQSPESPGEVKLSTPGRHHDAASPAYASIDDYKLGLNVVPNYSGNLKRLSSSCDCLDMHEAIPNHTRVEYDSLMYDKLTPMREAVFAVNSSIYDSLGPREDLIKSESSSPDPCDDYVDQKMKYLKRTHKYEYIGVDLNSEKSGSNSPIENPSDWTSSLPVGLANRFSLVGKSKETKTLPRRKQLPMQESRGELTSSEPGYSTVSKPRPPRISRENSVENSNSQVRKTSRSVAQAGSSVEMVSSTDSVPETRRESVFSNGSTSSAELEPKVGYDRVKREHSNSPVHKETHEIWMKSLPPDPPYGLLECPDGNSEPPAIPKRGLTESSSPDQTNKSKKSSNSSPPLPPKPQESRFTVPLPQAQFDFDKLSPPPKPKVLYPLDSNYAAVTFANGDYSHVEPVINSHRPSVKISQVHSDVSYVAVDFEMTKGLQRTSEQVADHQREFFETQHHVN